MAVTRVQRTAGNHSNCPACLGVFPGLAAGISYVYDDAGRLRAVIDPASDTAVYAYDAVGNLTGITRQA